MCLEEAPAVEEGLELPVASAGFLDPPLGEVTSLPDISQDFEPLYRGDINELIASFSDVFSEVPGCTSILEHDIILNTTDRIKAKMYPIPIHLQPYFKEEVDKLYEQGIIQLSSSPRFFPCCHGKESR